MRAPNAASSRRPTIAAGLLAVLSAACAETTVGGPDGPDCSTVDDHLECTYKTVGDLAIQVDVHGAAPGDLRPAVVWIHGGALLFGHRRELLELEEQLSRYLDRGYVVASIDYRLAPATPLDEIQRDVADAHAWLRREGPGLGIDPDRIGVVGHSAGAYLALSLGHLASPRPRAVISFYGYGRLGWYAEPAYLEEDAVDPADPDLAAVRGGPPVANSSLDELDRRGKLYVHCRQTGSWVEEVAGLDPADAAALAALEPLRHVDADYPPAMLLHGEADDDVPFDEAEAMFDALDAAGVPFELVHDALPRYEGSSFGHGFDEDMDAPGVRRAFEEALDFLDLHAL